MSGFSLGAVPGVPGSWARARPLCTQASPLPPTSGLPGISQMPLQLRFCSGQEAGALSLPRPAASRRVVQRLDPRVSAVGGESTFAGAGSPQSGDPWRQRPAEAGQGVDLFPVIQKETVCRVVYF